MEILIISSLVLLYGAIEKQEKVHALSERILGIVARVSTFHASFEQDLSGDPVMDPSKAWELLDNIQRDAEDISQKVMNKALNPFFQPNPGVVGARVWDLVSAMGLYGTMADIWISRAEREDTQSRSLICWQQYKLWSSKAFTF